MVTLSGSISYRRARFYGARPNLALRSVMERVEARRASRHYVEWPARVRLMSESKWHTGRVLNLSVTGVVLQVEQVYGIGERVEVEIDFLAQPECKTVVSRVGHVVREHAGRPYSAAMQFE